MIALCTLVGIGFTHDERVIGIYSCVIIDNGGGAIKSPIGGDGGGGQSGGGGGVSQVKPRPDPEKVHCDPKVQNQIDKMRGEARRTHGETGFSVDWDPNSGNIAVSEIVRSDLSTEVNQSIGPNTIATFHTHLGMSVYPSRRDRDVAQGKTDAFKKAGALGRTSVSYVSTDTTLTLFNGANPKEPNGKGDRVVDAAKCPK